jgi:hypothetical protein
MREHDNSIPWAFSTILFQTHLSSDQPLIGLKEKYYVVVAVTRNLLCKSAELLSSMMIRIGRIQILGELFGPSLEIDNVNH